MKKSSPRILTVKILSPKIWRTMVYGLTKDTSDLDKTNCSPRPVLVSNLIGPLGPLLPLSSDKKAILRRLLSSLLSPSPLHRPVPDTSLLPPPIRRNDLQVESRTGCSLRLPHGDLSGRTGPSARGVIDSPHTDRGGSEFTALGTFRVTDHVRQTHLPPTSMIICEVLVNA